MTEPANGGLKSIALRGGVAVGLSQAVQMAMRLVSVVALSRLLVPADFGLMAALAPLIAFVALVQGLGMQQAVIRHQALAPVQLSRIFWLTSAASLLCAALVAASAPLVAGFYRDPRLVWLTVAAAVPLVLSSLASLPVGVLNRELRFSTVAAIDAGAAVAGVLCAVIAALLGAGYWALLVATFAANATSLLASWCAARFRPGRPDFTLPDRALLGFGANLSGFSLVNFFSRNLDNILIGRVWGPVQLGFYDRAYMLLLFPLQAVMQPIGAVMLPLLSRIETDKVQLRDVYLRTIFQVMLLIVPGMAALACASDDVIAVLFGPAWAETAPIFALLGWAGLLQPLGSSTGWLFVCQGRTREMFRWGIYGAVTTVIGFFAGLPWGAVGVAAAYTLGDYLVRSPVLYWVMGRVGPVRMRDMLVLQMPFVIAGAATKGVHDLVLRDGLGLTRVAMIAASVAVAYALALAAQALVPAGRRHLAETTELLGRLARRRVAG